MSRQADRFRILEDGRLEIVDPSFEDLKLLQELDPNYKILEANLPGFDSPRFQAARRNGTGSSITDLSVLTDSHLQHLHDKSSTSTSVRPATGEASLLHVKAELARRALARCDLCAHRCAINRLQGERGICRLGVEACVADAFSHIGEEAPINPSFVISLTACGLRCRYCQQHALLDPGVASATPISPVLWRESLQQPLRSLSFVGGNPDENLPGILQFLLNAPSNANLPIVWNTHAYSTPRTINLLRGIVDLYLPDFKYGNNDCARRLSRAPQYASVALSAIRQMLAQGVPVIVRILVLPGHLYCCHLPALNALAALRADNLWVSIRDQYSPDHRITSRDQPLNRRPSTGEVQTVAAHADNLGLLPVPRGRPLRDGAPLSNGRFRSERPPSTDE